MGLTRASLADFGAHLAERDELLRKLPSTLLVLSNGDCDLLA